MKKLSFLLLAAAAFGGCKKDDATTTPTPVVTKTDLLTAKSWKITAQTLTITTNGTTISDNTLDACDKDDAYKFNTDKSLVVDAGTNKCLTSDPQKETGTWAFPSSDETKLRITLPNEAINGDLTIKELTATTLHLYGTQTTNNVTYTVDATYAPY